MENKNLSNSVIFSKGEPLPEQFRKNFYRSDLPQYDRTL
jgi:hypothetical protein